MTAFVDRLRCRLSDSFTCTCPRLDCSAFFHWLCCLPAGGEVPLHLGHGRHDAFHRMHGGVGLPDRGAERQIDVDGELAAVGIGHELRPDEARAGRVPDLQGAEPPLTARMVFRWSSDQPSRSPYPSAMRSCSPSNQRMNRPIRRCPRMFDEARPFRREHRRQRERHEQRQQCRDDDRDAELAEDASDHSTHQRDGEEHHDVHQRDRDRPRSRSHSGRSPPRQPGPRRFPDAGGCSPAPRSSRPPGYRSPVPGPSATSGSA